MARRTQNLELYFDYNIAEDTFEIFVNDNDANWEVLDSSVGLILNSIEEEGITLPQPITIGTETDYFEYPTKIAQLKTRLYNILNNKGVSVSADDTLNVLISDVGTDLVGSDDVKKLVSGTLTTFINPSGNTTIAQYLFYGCSQLTTADLTGISSINNYTFYNCTALTYLNAPNCTNVGQYALYGCSSLQQVNLSMTNNVYIATYSFYECTSLETVNLYGFSNGTIYPYTFYNCLNLKYIDLSSITSIEQYGLYNCQKLDNLDFQNITRVTTYSCYKIGINSTYKNIKIEKQGYISLYGYAFAYSAIKSVNVGSITLGGSYIFTGSDLERFEGKINTGSSEVTNSLATCHKLVYIDFKDSTLTSFELGKGFCANNHYVEYCNVINCDFKNFGSGGYQFYALGNTRTSISTALTLDFRNSTFLSVPIYCFAETVNTIIYLPSTVTTINANAFNTCDKLQLFLNSSPSLSNVSAFADNTNLEIYVPFENFDTLKNATNWDVYVDYMYAYTSGDNVIDNYGGVFPSIDPSSQVDIAFFVDKNYTTLATTPVRGEIYYCKYGPTYYTIGESFNCSITVSDGINTYSAGDQILIGTQLTITLTGTNGYTPYLVYINDELIEDQTSQLQILTYNIIMTSNISIFSAFWDRINNPFNLTMDDYSWNTIKYIVKSGEHRSLNWVGQTKNVTIENYTYMVRMVDGTANRYIYVKNNSTTNAVFEFVDCYRITSQFSNSSVGGENSSFDTSLLNQTLNSTIYELFPNELKNIISEYKVPIWKRYASSITMVPCKIFVPTEYEFGLSNYSYGDERTSIFNLYNNYTNYSNPHTGIAYAYRTDATKKFSILNLTTTVQYWTRSVSSSRYGYSVKVATDGYSAEGSTTSSLYFAPCFAI